MPGIRHRGCWSLRMIPRHHLLFALHLHAGRSWESPSGIVSYFACLFLVPSPCSGLWIAKENRIGICEWESNSRQLLSGGWELGTINWLDLLLEGKTFWPSGGWVGLYSLKVVLVRKSLGKDLSSSSVSFLNVELEEERKKRNKKICDFHRDLGPIPSLWKLAKDEGLKK